MLSAQMFPPQRNLPSASQLNTKSPRTHLSLTSQCSAGRELALKWPLHSKYTVFAEIYVFGFIWWGQGQDLSEALTHWQLCKHEFCTLGSLLARPGLKFRWGGAVETAEVPPTLLDPTGSLSASILNLQSALYIAARIISEAFNVYHLFYKSKLIKGIKAPCRHLLLLSLLIFLNILLQESQSHCHTCTRLALCCCHSLSPSNTSPSVPSWASLLEHVSSSVVKTLGQPHLQTLQVEGSSVKTPPLFSASPSFSFSSILRIDLCLIFINSQ